MRRPRLITIGLLATAAALTGCAGTPSPTDAPATSEPAEPAPAPADEAAPASARAVPDACAALPLTPGAALDGAALGSCVAVALSSYGSGRMEMATDSTGVIEFTYDPDYSFQGEFSGPSGDMALVFTDGVMWMDSGNGPVRGDVSSDDLEAQMVGVTGELYRAYSDLQETAKLVQAQPDWTVAEATEQIATPDGATVEAYRITSAGAFTWNEIPVDEFVLWFADEWVPVATEATVAAYGMTSTQSQRFFDLGAPITIEAPAP